jgi:hypothetical protein
MIKHPALANTTVERHVVVRAHSNSLPYLHATLEQHEKVKLNLTPRFIMRLPKRRDRTVNHKDALFIQPTTFQRAEEAPSHVLPSVPLSRAIIQHSSV